jgi:hypothetical protein
VKSSASIAFDRIVSLVLSGALNPVLLTPGQTASERAMCLQQERACLRHRLTEAGVRLPANVAVHELRSLAAAAGIRDLDPNLPAWAAQGAPAANSERTA